MVLILAKSDLNLKEMEGFILSPGNIFWQQKSGTHVLLSAKSDFLNFPLIEKLSNANHILLIENRINLQLQHDFIEYFKGHQSEVLVKEKLRWRFKLLTLFSEELGKEEVSQFEVDQLAWMVFSALSYEEARAFMEKDIELFKRSMSVATSYTLCAFLLGYYSDEFLSRIFTETFVNLMDIRMPNFIPGSKWEMTDLEGLLCALNDHYSSAGDNLHPSIFHEIKNSLFKCDERTLNVLKKCMEQKS